MPLRPLKTQPEVDAFERAMRDTTIPAGQYTASCMSLWNASHDFAITEVRAEIASELEGITEKAIDSPQWWANTMHDYIEKLKGENR